MIIWSSVFITRMPDQFNGIHGLDENANIVPNKHGNGSKMTIQEQMKRFSNETLG